ncbi:MAG: hypothetical protein ACFB4I_00800 [Cyanophyceae cyanobacterium]
MEIQKQITELEHKVDRLHQTVEHLSEKITALTLNQSSNTLVTASTTAPAVPDHNSFNSAMEHKDILIDGNGWHHDTKSEKGLSPDTQIRRLTAQLTAAYNRIATLEEQLFDCRIHS